MTKIKTKSSRWWSLFQNSAKSPFILALKNNAHLCHQSIGHFHPLKGLFSNQTIVGIKPKRIFIHNIGSLPGNQLISQLSLAAQKPRDRCSGCSVMETLAQDPPAWRGPQPHHLQQLGKDARWGSDQSPSSLAERRKLHTDHISTSCGLFLPEGTGQKATALRFRRE